MLPSVTSRERSLFPTVVCGSGILEISPEKEIFEITQGNENVLFAWN